ncbi:Dolichyl-diphosphooligosaccharide--protein glycosyltransferase subunit DAD1 [Galdieria sulphuraria]|uniref:Dolichyl-diphosphooligosaccharide--protein glycosyltransferase subunit OST2 n=1 Tax=Galdieria sulphuraria TaxID=130081 RepID=M2Y443_GALSU|nr:oligosaccharyltransferase complex subunit epsilon [Galdieria sulphuraria]EME30723.1 oligosaccharyltransferase complex subunit epsilon [Galdieria sulphuraria]GJD10795.1 Dolichyl-diphosphooligosaccharide--protein glycosyltransferase subunit DAD1 [Galdieria sulphuraria]|eukprot:XP_005707243.1 oligosaccharyltransferase complex subunit epsilon [Galdieria sulphuraria]
MIGTSIVEASKQLLVHYKNSVPYHLKVIDAFLLYVAFTAAIQFVYVLLVGTFPFNAFLAGFFSCIGVFVLTVGLRMQLNPQNQSPANRWQRINPSRAFTEWLFCNLVLHIAVINFIG